MFNLKDLQEVSRQRSQGLREQKALQKTLQGFRLLEQVHQEGFCNKARIRKATECFLTAVDYQIDDILPYLGLAYIFNLIEQYQAALEFVDAALKIEPENALLHAFAELLQAELSQSSETGTTSIEPHLDYDALYDQAEELLQQQIQAASQVPLSPSSQPQTLEMLKEHMHRVLETQKLIQEKLNVLDQEFDIGPLEHLTRSLQIVFQRFKAIYRQSKQLLNVHADISLTREESQRLFKLLHSQGYLSPEYDQNLELILDRCDAIADQLDEFESQHVTIAELLPLYESLVQEVQEVQEAMDDLPRDPSLEKMSA